jgi:alcohol dehydrogenase (cytochrome c)
MKLAIRLCLCSALVLLSSLWVRPAITSRDAGWTIYGGNYAAWRYSDLTQITSENVSRLSPKWIFQTQVPGRTETTPLVIGNAIYFTGPSNHAFAVDLRTGHMIWHYSRIPPGSLGLCCGQVNRGFAVLGNSLLKVNIEDTLVALDVATGEPLWETVLADYRKGYSGTLAPLVIKDKVLVGTGGGEFGIRGFVDAYDGHTGKRLWRFYTIPDSGEPGVDTWGKESYRHGGGATWMTGTYDPELNLVYWGVGNPGPDMNGDIRPGDNLYTCSVVALDADTGRLKWHFQFTPHDTHDWDALGDLVLVDLTVGGQKVKGLIQANRNGYFYALDRASGKFLFARPYTRVNWSDGIGPDGRPRVVKGLEPSEQGVTVCPGMGGGHNWQPTAYNPRTSLYYFGSTDGCQIFHRNDREFVEGQWYQLSGNKRIPGEDETGSLIAMEPSTGRIRWRFTMVENPSGGTLTTAGNLVFTADNFGNLIALDATRGAVLWHFQTGSPIAAAPITYTFEGKQYVAVAAGSALIEFGLP